MTRLSCHKPLVKTIDDTPVVPSATNRLNTRRMSKTNIFSRSGNKHFPLWVTMFIVESINLVVFIQWQSRPAFIADLLPEHIQMYWCFLR